MNSSDIDQTTLDNINQYFAATLKQLRSEKSMTQLDLSEASGLSHRMISDMEREIVQPSLLTLFKLAKGLNMGFQELTERLLANLKS